MTRRSLILVFALTLLAGCVREAPNLSLVPADDLYSQGVALYEEGRYGQAIPHLEAFVDNHFGDPRAPDARLRLGRAYMERGEELTAILHYQRLVNDFPSSPLQLDARFGVCEAYNELSPRPQLDQEYTISALVHCESIGQYYPDTPQAETATQYVTELRHKLAKKLYDTGRYYRQRRAYDAAVVYLSAAAEEYPNTSIAPLALRELAEVYDVMGYVEDAQEAREALRTRYPAAVPATGVDGPQSSVDGRNVRSYEGEARSYGGPSLTLGMTRRERP